MPGINENLRRLRKAKGMTQSEAADSISVTRQTVSSYESGRTQPDLETLKRLAEAYQVDLLDVLYGGNRRHRRIKRLELAFCILAAIMLFGSLARSALYWTVNEFFPIRSGTAVTADNVTLFETRFAIRDIADKLTDICAGIFFIGCAALLYPAVTVVRELSLRKLLLAFGIMLAAMCACALPFAAADEVFGFGEYLLPVWSGLTATLLFFAVILSARLITYTYRRLRREPDR
jgi:transcriptional regulator with XRE-family HTH domain